MRGKKSYLCVRDRARFVEAAEVTQAGMLFSPWSKRYQIAMMQIHSWVQWEILDKASFSLARQCNGCFPSHRYEEEWRSRCLVGFPCALPQDGWDKRAGSWLSWFNRLKRRFRNFSPNNCSLFSKIDRACLSLIHLRVIRRRGGGEGGSGSGSGNRAPLSSERPRLVWVRGDPREGKPRVSSVFALILCPRLPA